MPKDFNGIGKKIFKIFEKKVNFQVLFTFILQITYGGTQKITGFIIYDHDNCTDI